MFIFIFNLNLNECPPLIIYAHRQLYVNMLGLFRWFRINKSEKEKPYEKIKREEEKAYECLDRGELYSSEVKLESINVKIKTHDTKRKSDWKPPHIDVIYHNPSEKRAIKISKTKNEILTVSDMEKGGERRRIYDVRVDSTIIDEIKKARNSIRKVIDEDED